MKKATAQVEHNVRGSMPPVAANNKNCYETRSWDTQYKQHR